MSYNALRRSKTVKYDRNNVCTCMYNLCVIFLGQNIPIVWILYDVRQPYDVMRWTHNKRPCICKKSGDKIHMYIVKQSQMNRRSNVRPSYDNRETTNKTDCFAPIILINLASIFIYHLALTCVSQFHGSIFKIVNYVHV